MQNGEKKEEREQNFGEYQGEKRMTGVDTSRRRRTKGKTEEQELAQAWPNLGS